MKKIFIDCGFYAGGSIAQFKLTPEYTDDFMYYGFDPMLDLEKAKLKWPNVILKKAAIWTKDGEIDFYSSSRHRGKANGVFHNKRAGKENNLKVQCIDFSKWLYNNITKDDYVVLKMDTEGAEYEIMPKMIQDKTIDLIDVLYLEWHPGRTDDNDKSKANRIQKELTREDLIIRQSLEWYLGSIKK
jgi:FkbM family methyltransferase